MTWCVFPDLSLWNVLRKPGSYSSKPGSYSSKLGSYSSKPGPCSSKPESCSSKPGSYFSKPGSYSSKPWSYSSKPGSCFWKIHSPLFPEIWWWALPWQNSLRNLFEISKFKKNIIFKAEGSSLLAVNSMFLVIDDSYCYSWIPTLSWTKWFWTSFLFEGIFPKFLEIGDFFFFFF